MKLLSTFAPYVADASSSAPDPRIDLCFVDPSFARDRDNPTGDHPDTATTPCSTLEDLGPFNRHQPHSTITSLYSLGHLSALDPVEQYSARQVPHPPSASPPLPGSVDPVEQYGGRSVVASSYTPSGKAIAYHCSFCGKKFDQRSHYRTHLYTHTGERPFNCELCGLCFTQKSNMTVHMRRKHNM